VSLGSWVAGALAAAVALATPCACQEQFRLILQIGDRCTSQGTSETAVISPNVCTSTALGEINSLLVPWFVNLIESWNDKAADCNQRDLVITGNPQAYANNILLAKLNSIKLSDCTDADTLASFNFYSDASCRVPVATFDAVPRTCHAPHDLNFSNPIFGILPAGTPVLNSCMNASADGKPTVSIPILIDFDVLNAAGRCAASPNSGGKDKLSAGDDVGITIGVLVLILAGAMAYLYHKNGQRNQSLGELNNVMLNIADVEEQSMQLFFEEEALDNAAIGTRGSIKSNAGNSFTSSIQSEGSEGRSAHSGSRRF
jgi:hypothetical protein